MNVLICGGVFMVKQQPNRKEQAADAVRSGSVMAGASFLLALPAALLIREGLLPETSVQLTALVCAGFAALLSEVLCFGKRRGGYAYIPLSALAAALILLLVGACLPMNGWDIGCVLKTLCVMTAMMTSVYFIKMNKKKQKITKKPRGLLQIGIE